MIECFKRSLDKNIRYNKDNIARYKKGLEKLELTKKEVIEKKEELEVLQPKLKVSSKNIDKLIVKVEKEQVIADEKKVECEAEEVKCNGEREVANKLKDECEAEVKLLEPILNAALKNLEGVTRANIDFIKQTMTP